MRIRNNRTASKRGQESTGVECESALSDLVRQMWSGAMWCSFFTLLSTITLLVLCYLIWALDVFNPHSVDQLYFIFGIGCFASCIIGAKESFESAQQAKQMMLGMERCEFHQTEIAESPQETDTRERIMVVDDDRELAQVGVTT